MVGSRHPGAELSNMRHARARWFHGPVAVLVGVLVVLVIIGIVLALTLRSNGKGPAKVPPKLQPVIPATLPTGLASAFVGRVGATLTRNGDWFRFTGFDNFVMLGCGTEQQQLNAAQQEAYFASLRPGSVTRIWLFAGTDLAGFDAVMAAAARHHQLVLPTLADGVGGCGESVKNVQWLRSGYRTAYVPWVRTIVSRYKSNPTIMMWDLINEPPGSDGTALRAFVDAVGGLVHSLDPNHLVAVGTNLPSEYGGPTGYIKVFSSPEIDVVSLHEYDQVAEVSGHLAEALVAARAADKPVIIGEYGVVAKPSGNGSFRTSNGGTCLTFAQRASLVQGKQAAYFQTPGVAGTLYWSYTADKHSDCSLGTFSGDPVIGVIDQTDLYPGVARLHRG